MVNKFEFFIIFLNYYFDRIIYKLIIIMQRQNTDIKSMEDQHSPENFCKIKKIENDLLNSLFKEREEQYNKNFFYL